MKESESTIDWAEIHRRLEQTRRDIEEGLRPTEEQKREILAGRAAALARVRERQEAEKGLERVVEFLLADEHYAIEMAYVREILPLKEITPVPCTPSFVLGITNIRGEILSLIDLKDFFDLPEKGITDLNKLIILHTEDMELGVLADRVLGERSVSSTAVQPTLPTLAGIGAEYLKGVTEGRLIILDAGRILSDERIVVEEEV